MHVGLPYLVDKGGEDVASGGGALLHADVADLGIPKCHTVVVLRRDDGVFSTALLDEFHPCLGIVVLGCEPFALVHIFVIGKIAVVERPAFAHTFHGIDAPMDEHTELGLCKPFHAFGLLGFRLCLFAALRHHRQSADHGRQGQHTHFFHSSFMVVFFFSVTDSTVNATVCRPLRPIRTGTKGHPTGARQRHTTLQPHGDLRAGARLHFHQKRAERG